MIGITRTIFTLPLIAVAASTDAAQGSTITRADFLRYMERSDKLTRTSPCRVTVTIQSSEIVDRGWRLYSSMVEERILPDRSHLIYKVGRPGEFIRVGKTIYGRETDGTWVRSPGEAEGWLVSPSSTPVFKGPIVEYIMLGPEEFTDTYSTVLKVVSKPDSVSADLEKQVLTYTYWFDEKAILYKHESIAFNGSNWIRRVESYEYDPEIKIVAPIE